jgi:hypothetical protein
MACLDDNASRLMKTQDDVLYWQLLAAALARRLAWMIAR